VDEEESQPKPLINMLWMVCQYSTRGFVSSGKRDIALDPGAAEGGDDASHTATGTIIVGRSRALPASLTTITRRANSAKVWRSRTPAKLYVYDTLLERLP
jgi:hypothetical protein